MPIETKTREELEAIARGAMAAFISEADTSKGSDYDISAKMNAALAQSAQRSAAHVALQIFPKTADDDFILLHAQERGTQKQAATAAVGRVLITAASGTPTQPATSALTHTDGTAYSTDGGATVALPAFSGKQAIDGSTTTRILITPDTSGMAVGDPFIVNGETRAIAEVLTAISAIDVDGPPLSTAPGTGDAVAAKLGVIVAITATTTGAATNKEVGETLTLTVPDTTIVAATVVLELSGGGDEESYAELASRLEDHFAAPPGGGNAAQIREWARTTPGVRLADAIVYPNFRGLGSVDIIPIGVASCRLVGGIVCSVIAEYVRSKLFGVVDVKVLPFTYTVLESAMPVTVVVPVGSGADWSGAFTIGASSTTLRLRVTTDPRTTIEIGDRVLLTLKPGWRWRTYVREVTGTGYDGAYFIDISEELPIAPVSGDPSVIPGFAQAQEILDALEAVYDGLGPGATRTLSNAATFERVPSPGEAWPDILREGAIGRAVLGIAGTIDFSVGSLVVTTPEVQEVVRPGKITLTVTEG